MMRKTRLAFSVLPLIILTGGVSQAQVTKGFTVHAEALATGVERNAQSELWVMEVDFKPMRMIPVTLTDPRTGRTTRDFVWYLVYRVVTRSFQQVNANDLEPVNQFDPAPGAPVFSPEFTLVTDDNGVQTRHSDVILREALERIRAREVRDPQLRPFLRNSVEVVGPIPPATPEDAEEVKSLFGVAMWRGVDPKTDFFTVIISGFSNGYKLVKGPVKYDRLRELVTEGSLKLNDTVWDTKTAWEAASEAGNLFDDSKQPFPNAQDGLWFYTLTSDRIDPAAPPQIWRKTLVQKFRRPGDEFDQTEGEFRNEGDPEWIYRPDAPRPKAKSKQAQKTQPVRR